MSTPHAASRSRLPKWATSFGNQIIASLLLGIVLGALALALGGDAKSNPNWLMVTLDTIGSSYITLLKAAVVPLIFTAVVASISNLSQVTNAARLDYRVLRSAHWYCDGPACSAGRGRAGAGQGVHRLDRVMDRVPNRSDSGELLGSGRQR